MFQQLSKEKRCRAFTLIELLIVVAIIGILAAIAVPNFLLAQQRAMKAQCAGNLHTLGVALATYRFDHGRYPPGDGTAGPDPSPADTAAGKGPAANGSWSGISRLLLEQGYITNEETLYCPALRKRHKDREIYYRYAYNNSAADTGGTLGGADDIFHARGHFWLVRCLWVPSRMGFHPETHGIYPHGDEVLEDGTVVKDVMENVLMNDLAVYERNGKRDFESSFMQRPD